MYYNYILQEDSFFNEDVDDVDFAVMLLFIV